MRPQLSALDERADLVTIGIGGNDLGLFSRLVRTCLSLGAQDPTGEPCAESAAGRQLLAGVPRIEVKLERVLRTIQDLAPRARVVVVGYPRIAPVEGSCPRLLPVAAGDVAFGDELLRALDQAMSDAAAAAGVDYLDLYAASSGHDVCSEEPWVNGRHTRAGVALAFHPLAAGAEATADLLEDLLTSS